MTQRYLTEYKVTIGDINYGGHLGNDKALVIFQDARIHLLREFGNSEMDIGDQCGMIMVESGVRYLREVFLHDELKVLITVTDLRTKKFTLEYRVMRLSDDEMVLRGFTSFLAFDYTTRKVVSLPGSFREKLCEYAEG